MFELDLQKKLMRIFGLSKVTYLAPTEETAEQDTLFITITEVKARTGGNIASQSARVKGVLTVFSQGMLHETHDAKEVRLSYGYFSRRIAQAAYADTKPFFFEEERDIAGSPARVQNLHERQVNFTFLYSAQYDPDRGELNEVDFQIEFGG
jgi:hypothetical protein